MENLNLNLPPFYPGQRIVAIADHTDGIFKKGDEFVVWSIEKPCCYWVLDIGIRSNNMPVSQYSVCADCGKRRFTAFVWWVCYTRFAPIEERFISFADVIAKESPLIGIN